MTKQLKGILLTIVGASLWGLSGVCSQYLFQIKEIPTAWLISVRLSLAGLLFLLASLANSDKRAMIHRIFSSKATLFEMLIYAIFGLLLGQLTYFFAIQYSNASTATVLQYTSPILIMLYASVRDKKLPKMTDILSLAIVMAGVFALATHGNIHSLSISLIALILGLSASFTMMLYSVLPEHLMGEFGTLPVLSVAMPFCGFLMVLYIRPLSNITGIWDIKTFLVLATIILIGTFLSFYCYLSGLNMIGSSKASICTAAEPVMSTILTVTIMHAAFGFMDLLGLLLIVGGVLFLTITSKQ